MNSTDDPPALKPPNQRSSISEAIPNAEILAPIPQTLDDELASYPLTDLGNAERFERRYADKLLCCENRGWLVWDGRRWTSEGADAARRQAEHAIARALQDEAAAMRRRGLMDESEKLSKWGRQSEAGSRLAAISERAGSMMRVSMGDLDSDRMKLNVLNGTLHLIKDAVEDYVQLRPHSPADRITALAPVTFDPDATCPRFDQFMDEVHPHARDKGAMQRFLQEWAGLSLTGHTGEQKLTFHYGRGRNGKSVWIATIASVLGDYASTIKIESLLETGRPGSGSQASPDIAKIRGVRFLQTSEPGKGAVLAEGVIKQLTGEDTITARHLHKDFFEFRPEAKLTMQGNYRPKVSGTDEGIWGRIILVPWLQFIPPDKRDPELQQKLRQEASGILNRFLDGLRQWMERGRLLIPESILKATAEYRSDSDPLGRFLESCTKEAQGSRIKAADMHQVYLAWARANGDSLWSAKGLGAALLDRGYRRQKSSNVYWLDLQLTMQAADFSSEGPNEAGEEMEEADYG